jgi:hypothetical protein
MNIQIQDPNGLATGAHEKMISRLGALAGMTTATDAIFAVERKVRSGKGGIFVGSVLEGKGVRLTFQHGRGGDRFRGILSSSLLPKQLLEQLAAKKLPGVTVTADVLPKRRRTRNSSQMSKREQDLVSSYFPPTRSSKKDNGLPKSDLPAKASSLQEDVERLLEVEKRGKQLLADLEKLGAEVKALEAEAEAMKPQLEQLHRLRQALQSP